MFYVHYILVGGRSMGQIELFTALQSYAVREKKYGSTRNDSLEDLLITLGYPENIKEDEEIEGVNDFSEVYKIHTPGGNTIYFVTQPFVSYADMKESKELILKWCERKKPFLCIFKNITGMTFIVSPYEVTQHNDCKIFSLDFSVLSSRDMRFLSLLTYSEIDSKYTKDIIYKYVLQKYLKNCNLTESPSRKIVSSILVDSNITETKDNRDSFEGILKYMADTYFDLTTLVGESRLEGWYSLAYLNSFGITELVASDSKKTQKKIKYGTLEDGKVDYRQALLSLIRWVANTKDYIEIERYLKSIDSYTSDGWVISDRATIPTGYTGHTISCNGESKKIYVKDKINGAKDFFPFAIDFLKYHKVDLEEVSIYYDNVK